MLGIQSNLPVSNPVKFGHSVDYDDGYKTGAMEPDEFYHEPSQEEIEAERDEKLADINQTKNEMDRFADSLDQNPSKLSKGASKAVRFVSGALGLVTAFVTAKYGAKISIGILKGVAKSNVAKDAVNISKSAFKPVANGFKSLGNAWSKFVGSPVIKAFKNTTLGKKTAEFMAKPNVKSFIEKAQGYGEATKTLVKSVNKQKVQSAVENTLAASTTASVLIDDLAGRNKNKSNLDLALGASGGDK